MSWRISILDKSPIAENETAADALARTLALAQQAENLAITASGLPNTTTLPILPALAGAADCPGSGRQRASASDPAA